MAMRPLNKEQAGTGTGYESHEPLQTQIVINLFFHPRGEIFIKKLLKFKMVKRKTGLCRHT